MKTLYYFAFIAILAACGTEPDSDTDGEKASGIEGTWKSDCWTIGDSTNRLILQFDGSEMKQLTVNYMDSACLGIGMTETETFSYALDGEKIDMVVKSVKLEIMNDKMLAAANEAELYGKDDWVKNAPVRIEGLRRTPDADMEYLATEKTYSLIKVEGELMYIGDKATGSGVSEKTRPTAYKDNFPLSKD